MGNQDRTIELFSNWLGTNLQWALMKNSTDSSVALQNTKFYAAPNWRNYGYEAEIEAKTRERTGKSNYQVD